MHTTKSFEISKHVVWNAYKRVKANKGAAGVDDAGVIYIPSRAQVELLIKMVI